MPETYAHATTSLFDTPALCPRNFRLTFTDANKNNDSIVDLGNPIGASAQIGAGANANQGELAVAGYSILQSDSLSSVQKILNDHPHRQMPGAVIQVLVCSTDECNTS
jgi:hypothetical protein